MNISNLYCHRCGHELEVIEDCGCETCDTEIGHYYKFLCPCCGAAYEVEEPDEENKKNYDFWKDQDISERVGSEGDHIMNDICLNCGHKVYVGNNFMLSDCMGEDLPEDDDKMNYCINQCQCCGITETRWDNSENEKKDLLYWQTDVYLKNSLKGYSLPILMNIWKDANDMSDEQFVLTVKSIIKHYE